VGKDVEGRDVGGEDDDATEEKEKG
jgi:hypothetical protein